ncbi:MAG: carbohydrate ABC transporter permease [Chloroflexi bacterium]|nr:MAG: carbohydrate ABC transporter permease [Chloroflexota bacterium]MBL1193774.1 carbohydrate ABC transporter permease [Chloroflexota bacterium]NOH11067.1 carbohydrate ABC transporter permease [Chloroflexota bacterium]
MNATGQSRWANFFINGSLLFLVALWTIPTLGLLVSSVRTRFDIATSGWWAILPHQEWVLVDEIEIDDDLDRDGVMNIAGVTGTFEELREGIETEDGMQVLWIGNRRTGRVEVQEQQWVMRTDLTLDNYSNVLTGKEYQITQPDGTVITEQGDDMTAAFLNSLTVTIPATVIPILIAAFAAYGFAWMRFPGRKILFTVVVALLVVPLQIALVPILSDYRVLGLNGTFLAIWLAHTGFGLPLATYLLYSYVKGLPRDILESAFIDGASHFTIFLRLILPLSIPALASFAIFQFLWVWNDYLVALVFIGAAPDVQVLTMRLAEIVGSRGADWHLLTAGAFVTMVLPMVVFFSLQRFFVRGLLAGSVKG